MAFSDSEKTDIRRFCGYPVFGQSPNQFVGYRFFQAYGNLEFKMNNLMPAEEIVVRTTYLANLLVLESAVPTTSSNLDTDRAAVWYHNKNELRDREALLNTWRRKLCGFLGVPPGPDFRAPYEAGMTLVA